MRSRTRSGARGVYSRRGPLRRLTRLRRRSRRLAHRVGERREDETHVADNRVAHGGTGGLIRIAGDLDQLRPGRQQRAGLVLVIAEHGCAGHQHQIMALQLPRDAAILAVRRPRKLGWVVGKGQRGC